MFIKEMKMGQTNPQPSCSNKISYTKRKLQSSKWNICEKNQIIIGIEFLKDPF